ncbi:MAG TPA: serine hydrolase domain-containing protein [Caulobacteraceae bacterium]|nr:serine hydrolase domain-containing protein [Caulobacteraceae bacterium]
MSFTATDAERLRAAANAAMEDLRPSGFALGVVVGDDLAFAEGFGFADIESGTPQDPRLRQRIGSITKTMVGLCTMALVDEGRLSLDDRIVDHVPEVAFQGDGGAIRLRHLLSHTSGIGEVAQLEDMRKDITPTLWADAPDRDVLGLFPQGVLLEIAPETKWSYANLGFALLGEVVARAEGRPIGEVLKRRVFDPLGMSADLDDLPHPDLTTGYHRAPGEEAQEIAARDGTVLPQEPTVDGINIRGRYQYIRGGGAAGAVQATVPDMARYASALLRRGAGIVRPESFARLVGPAWAPDERLATWGLSFERDAKFGHWTFGHGGGVLGGWNSMLTVVPERNLALVLHCNTAFDQFGKLVNRLTGALLDAPPARLEGRAEGRMAEAAPGVFESLPGALTNFRIMGQMGRLQIKPEAGGLTLYARRGPWKRGVRMVPAGAEDFFHLDDDDVAPSRLTLIRNAAGEVTGLRCDRLVEMRRSETVQPWA